MSWVWRAHFAARPAWVHLLVLGSWLLLLHDSEAADALIRAPLGVTGCLAWQSRFRRSALWCKAPASWPVAEAARRVAVLIPGVPRLVGVFQLAVLVSLVAYVAAHLLGFGAGSEHDTWIVIGSRLIAAAFAVSVLTPNYVEVRRARARLWVLGLPRPWVEVDAIENIQASAIHLRTPNGTWHLKRSPQLGEFAWLDHWRDVASWWGTDLEHFRLTTRAAPSLPA